MYYKARVTDPAYYCYKAVGFRDVVLDTTETYYVLGEEWECKEMVIERSLFHALN